MRLRTRLLMTFGLACVALFIVIAIAMTAWRHEQQNRLDKLILDAQQLAWRRFEAGAIDRLKTIADSLSKQPQLAHAFVEKDAAALEHVMAGTDPDVRVDAFDTNGELMFSSSPLMDPDLELDAAAAQKILHGRPMLGGITPTVSDGLKFVVAIPVRRGNDVNGGIALGLALEPTLKDLGASLARQSAFIDLRGRAQAGNGAALLNELDTRLPVRRAAVLVAGDLRIVLTPVSSPDGHQAGSVATLQDVAAERAADLRWTLAIGGIAVLVIMTVLGTLFVTTRSTLAPLDRAVNVLTALSRGDTSIRIDAEHRDEAGLIADGITRLREEMLNLEVLREERERERWRQESIVREELRELAGTLDEAGKQEVLLDLEHALSDDRQERNRLAMLATVLHGLSQRIRAQRRTQEAFAALQQELGIARRMQLTILPRQFPQRADVSLSSFILPAKEVGGDFYDYFPLDDGRLGVVIADVSGKGVPAAFFMAICRTLLKTTARFLHSPAATLARVNALLAAENEEMMFVTLFYGILDPETGELVYANAGHNPPVLRSGDDVQFLRARGGMALAVDEAASYTEHTIRLRSDDVLFLYTDGVTEAQNGQGALFGEPALLSTIASGDRDVSVNALSDRVVTAVREFAGEAPQADDITCVVLRFTDARHPRGMPGSV